jgi:hypothetical protein
MRHHRGSAAEHHLRFAGNHGDCRRAGILRDQAGMGTMSSRAKSAA